MNQVADILGVTLPCLQARAAVMKEPIHKNNKSTQKPLVEHWQGRISFMKDDTTSSSLSSYHGKLDDDDTVSTCSLSDSESQDSSYKMVTWAEPLVTDVRERPRTSRNDKSMLYWQEQDYIEMRREATLSRRRSSSRQQHQQHQERRRLVKFADCAVTDVWTVPYAENKSQLFYTELELQEFLDEFVASLDKGMMD
mmetsp:Transcript_12764/g.18127  ORF Transcript_12764/g.18127 Transcript_12764/m.18127 type:complete len:196 (-) Transcript_12764:439-1026(-)